MAISLYSKLYSYMYSNIRVMDSDVNFKENSCIVETTGRMAASNALISVSVLFK